MVKKDKKKINTKGLFRKHKKYKSLMEQIAKGNPKALHQFYDLFGKTIYIIARSHSDSHENAEEVVNDTLVKIWNNASNLLSFENPDGWIYRVIVNTAYSKIKHNNTESINENEIAQQTYDRIEDTDEFYFLIKNLSDVEKQIMILKFVYDITFGEIAQFIKMPIGTVTSLYYRALDKVKKNTEILQ